MKYTEKILHDRRFVLIGIGILILFVIHFILNIDGSSPQHLAWKSTFLGDTTAYNTLAVRVMTFISRLNLVDPHKPVWKSNLAGDSLAAHKNP